MKMAYRLQMEQAQKLIMTPELRQAIMILQFATVELHQYIQQQCLENPVLEWDENLEDEETMLEADPGPAELDWLEYFDDSSDLGLPRQKLGTDEGRSGLLEQQLSRSSTLYEHLQWQLRLALDPGQWRNLGELLLGSLDDHGYLTCSVEELARWQGVNAGDLELVLGLIQDFDPPGVGARDVTECLLLQLKYLDVQDPLLEKVICHHLPHLAQGKLEKVAAQLGASPQQIQAARDFIRTLDPKPGRQFGPAQQGQYIVPDVVVQEIQGEWVVTVNDVAAPRLTINNYYRHLLRARETGDQTRLYIEKKLASARWLLRSIEQRRLTLQRLVESMVEFQRDFFAQGVYQLRPLTLREVAEAAEVHESTVSRATSNKYLQTPRGVYPLRFFFTSGVGNARGSATSSESIKRLLQVLIASEDKSNPLSDQRTANMLRDQGIMVSRRTVAKYRQGLDIPPAVCRKRF